MTGWISIWNVPKVIGNFLEAESVNGRRIIYRDLKERISLFLKR